MIYIDIDAFHGAQIEEQYNNLYSDIDRLVYTVHLMDKETRCTGEMRVVANRSDGTLALTDEEPVAHVWVYRERN